VTVAEVDPVPLRDERYALGSGDSVLFVDGVAVETLDRASLHALLTTAGACVELTCCRSGPQDRSGALYCAVSLLQHHQAAVQIAAGECLMTILLSTLMYGKRLLLEEALERVGAVRALIIMAQSSSTAVRAVALRVLVLLSTAGLPALDFLASHPPSEFNVHHGGDAEWGEKSNSDDL
jgi:hypothetical protein